MPDTATIKVHPSWLEDEGALINRLKQIISGDENGPFKQDSGYAWQIDGSNDWWATVKGNILTIAYRYNSEKFITLIPYLQACFK